MRGTEGMENSALVCRELSSLIEFFFFFLINILGALLAF